MESDAGEQLQEPVAAAGDAASQMRAARKKAGLSLADIAARTRVPLRHLEALERGDYGALPGITYCAGFARAFARAVGMDEVALVAKIRQEADDAGDFASAQFHIEEPVDPARIPPRILAWVAAIIALLIMGGYALWRIQLNAPPSEEAVLSPPPRRAVPVKQAPPPAVAQAGPVVLTAAEDVWLRINDGEASQLFEGMLKRGESFTVPLDAKNPTILTGRPDALAVTVGGRPVPPLGTAEKTISNFPISAAALLARGTAMPSSPAGAAPQAPGPASNAPPVTSPPPAARPQRPSSPSERKPAAANDPAEVPPAPASSPAALVASPPAVASPAGQ